MKKISEDADHGTVELFRRWLEKSEYVANLKVAIGVQAFVLIMGTMVIEQGHQGAGGAVLLSAYHLFCGYQANFRYKLACTLIAVPNLALATLFAIDALTDGSREYPIDVLWLTATATLGVVAAILSRVTGVPSQSERTIERPPDNY